jgi:hypothetical protein
LFLVAILSACGADSANTAAAPGDTNGSDSSDSGNSLDAGSSMIVDNGNIYTIDDFVTAGYKSVTQFELETLPGATDAWYGFYSQKDFELRFYESHDSALDQGVEPAEFAIGKSPPPWQKQPPVRFDAFAVVGNVVILCELELESCEALIAELD